MDMHQTSISTFKKGEKNIFFQNEKSSFQAVVAIVRKNCLQKDFLYRLRRFKGSLWANNFAPIFWRKILQSCVLGLKFFGAKISAKKALIKC